MKIKVEKWTFDGSKSYRIVQAEKCCDEILNSETVVLNYEYENDDDTDYCVKLVKGEWEYYSENYDYTYEKIKYCPFCGSKIEIEIVNTVDKTEEYFELKEKRKTLWSKCNKTDSKRESEELRIEVGILDSKINAMYNNDGLD